MRETQVSMTQLRQSLGNLVNRAAYGRERIILVAHGEPKAAIISVDELRHLQQLSEELITQEEQHSIALSRADHLRERIRQWQEDRGIEPEDSVQILNQVRAERDDKLVRLR
jgi:prevent-host-death family protein